jgi:hypothetical protein
MVMQQPAAAIDFIFSLAHLCLRQSVERAKNPTVDSAERRRGYLDKSPGL